MDNFEFYSPTRFVFGRGAEEKTGALVRKYGGTKALLHFGGGSVKANGVYDKVVASLEAAGVAYVPLGGVQPNPRSGLVREGIALCRREKIDFVLAVGGGSVIDSAKAIAFGTLYDGDFADFYFGKDVKRPTPVPAALPIGTVLTIAAAGSEGSGNSIITLEPDMLKRGATGDALRPAFSILNPEFTFTLPAYQTACGATDMFAHVVERYFTPTRDVAVSDELCELLIKSFFEQEAGYSDSIKNLYEAWLSGDEKTIAQISSEDEDESGLTDKQIKLIEEYNKTMLDDRNKVMAEKADIYIKEGKNIFFAVGAAHIVSGENSVIKLLEKKGYTIERIKI